MLSVEQLTSVFVYFYPKIPGTMNLEFDSNEVPAGLRDFVTLFYRNWQEGLFKCAQYAKELGLSAEQLKGAISVILELAFETSEPVTKQGV